MSGLRGSLRMKACFLEQPSTWHVLSYLYSAQLSQLHLEDLDECLDDEDEDEKDITVLL